MIKEFKSGYWYKYVGDIYNYFLCDNSKKILDGKFHKCIYGKKYYARFEDIDKGYYWDRLDFIENENNPDEKVKKCNCENCTNCTCK